MARCGGTGDCLPFGLLLACEASASLEAISIGAQAVPQEFRRDVIAVTRRGEASIAQIARDFGISESCLATG